MVAATAHAALATMGAFISDYFPFYLPVFACAVLAFFAFWLITHFDGTHKEHGVDLPDVVDAMGNSNCLVLMMIFGVLAFSVVVILGSIHSGGDPGIATRGWGAALTQQSWQRKAFVPRGNGPPMGQGLPAFPPLGSTDELGERPVEMSLMHGSSSSEKISEKTEQPPRVKNMRAASARSSARLAVHLAEASHASGGA